MDKIVVNIIVNYKKHRIETEPNKTLLSLLRNDLGLPGTKDGCQEGECGACNVLMDGKLINSCLLLAWQANGHEVLTVEGLARDGKLHPVQQAFVEAGAVQCGYCTPGVIMSVVDLLNRVPAPTEMQVREALAGNLCRCTGYYKIFEAVQKAAKEMSHE